MNTIFRMCPNRRGGNVPYQPNPAANILRCRGFGSERMSRCSGEYLPPKNLVLIVGVPNDDDVAGSCDTTQILTAHGSMLYVETPKQHFEPEMPFVLVFCISKR